MDHRKLCGLAAVIVVMILAGCQEITRKDHATCSTISQERGGNSPSTLNPPITAEVPNARVQVNSAGDQGTTR